MKDITIKYWGHLGRQEETKFQCADRKIDMIMRAAQRVDLSEVANCFELEILNLSNNMMEEVDLTPLSESGTLTTLLLENNHLTTLDLWPLSKCNDLVTIHLKNNRLAGLDLTPVFLSANVELDSYVVISADYILRYALTNEQFEKRFLLVRPDRIPWTAAPVIIWNKYETLAKTIDWSEIHQRIHTILDQVDETHWFAIQRGLLIGFSMDELAGYDGNPKNLLSTTSQDMDFSTAREAVFTRTIELLEKQVVNSGSTLFLDIEQMQTTKASKLIPKIVDARSKEMERAVVQTKWSVALMNSLWLTYYGFKILEALDIGVEHFGDGQVQDRIRESLNSLGFELKFEPVESTVSIESKDPIHASTSLKNYVFTLIEKAYSK
ncbi:MAG: hypothetical protein ACW987_03275 [Candidatus Thorarchaeota archaeon]|jgi:hypothetical protein